MAVGFVVSGMSIDHKRSPSLEDEFHKYGTAIAIVSAFAGLYLGHGVWVPAVAFAVGAALLLIYNRNWIWWTEIWAMLTIAWGLLTI